VSDDGHECARCGALTERVRELEEEQVASNWGHIRTPSGLALLRSYRQKVTELEAQNKKLRLSFDRAQVHAKLTMTINPETIVDYSEDDGGI